MFCVLAHADSSPSFYDQLVKLIQDKHIQSIDELLPHLDPSLRENYSLAFESRSPVGASAEKPRVILSNSDSKVILSFASDQSMTGGNKLELIEYNNVKAKPEFKLIEFPKIVGGSIHFNSNPESCMACHGSLREGEASLHHIWDTYPDWPGFYGVGHRGGTGFSDGASALPFFDREEKDFAKLKENANQGRLSHLVGLDKKSLAEVAEYNTKFSNNIQRLNMDRLTGLIQNHPDAERYTAALLSVDQEDFKKYLKKENLVNYDVTFNKYIEEYRAQKEKYFSDKLERIKKPYLKGELSVLDAEKVKGLKYVGTNVPFFFKRKNIYMGALSSADSFESEVRHVNFRIVMEKLGVPNELLGMSKGSEYGMVISPRFGVKDFYREYVPRVLIPNHPELKKYQDILAKEHASFSGSDNSKRNRLIKSLHKTILEKFEPIPATDCGFGSFIKRVFKRNRV